jgi:hypothetical protein
VRTQVDRDLTTVSRVDRLLGLNKILERQALYCISRLDLGCNSKKTNRHIFEGVWILFSLITKISRTKIF